MAGPSPGTYGGGGSSSSSVAHGGNGGNAVDDLDGDEAADLGQENALLAEDPIEEEHERTP
jgi:hypothetical protein